MILPGSEEANAETTVMIKSKSSAKRARTPIRLVRAHKEGDEKVGKSRIWRSTALNKSFPIPQSGKLYM